MSIEVQNVIVSCTTGMAHRVGDIDRWYDRVEGQDGKLTDHYGWTDCGIEVQGKLYRRAKRGDFKVLCRRCFR